MNYFFNILKYGLGLLGLIIFAVLYLRCFILIICNSEFTVLNFVLMAFSYIMILSLENYLKLL